MRELPARLERVLVCRTDNIGDVVLTLPLAGFLKQHVPGVQVDFLVRAKRRASVANESNMWPDR